MATKAKMNKCDYVKLKSFFYTTKEIINEMKRQHVEWEKYIRKLYLYLIRG